MLQQNRTIQSNNFFLTHTFKWDYKTRIILNFSYHNNLNFITEQPAQVEGLLLGAYSQNVVYMFWGLASETDRNTHVTHS